MAASDMRGAHELLEKAITLKNEGNTFYAGKDYRKAIGKYHRALFYLRAVDTDRNMHGLKGFFAGESVTDSEGLTENEITQSSLILRDCYNNLAACLLQRPDCDYSKVVSYCNSAIDISPGHTKALYRKGIALYYLKDFERSLQLLKDAESYSGDIIDPAITKYKRLCQQELARQNNQVRSLYKGIFERLGSSEDKIAQPPVVLPVTENGQQQQNMGQQTDTDVHVSVDLDNGVSSGNNSNIHRSDDSDDEIDMGHSASSSSNESNCPDCGENATAAMPNSVAIGTVFNTESHVTRNNQNRSATTCTTELNEFCSKYKEASPEKNDVAFGSCSPSIDNVFDNTAAQDENKCSHLVADPQPGLVVNDNAVPNIDHDHTHSDEDDGYEAESSAVFDDGD